MKVSVTVTVGPDSKKFSIPVGDGDKTFKWLGLVSASRYNLRSPHGQIRSREQRPIMGTGANLIPNTIYTDESVFYHPDAMIKDHIKEGQEVTVELINRVPVDSLGVPQMARWAYIAFSVSEHKVRRTTQRKEQQRCT